jgi:hypothetical protein
VPATQPSPTSPAQALALLLPWVNGDLTSPSQVRQQHSPAQVRRQLRAFLSFFDGSAAAGHIQQNYDGTADARRDFDFFGDDDEQLSERWWDDTLRNVPAPERSEPGDINDATSNAESALFELRVALRQLLERGFGDDPQTWAPDDDFFKLRQLLEEANQHLPLDKQQPLVPLHTPRNTGIDWWPEDGWASLRISVRNQTTTVRVGKRGTVKRQVPGGYVARVNGTLPEVVLYLVVQLLTHAEDGLVGRCIAPKKGEQTVRCGRFFIMRSGKRSGKRGVWRVNCDRNEGFTCHNRRNDELKRERRKVAAAIAMLPKSKQRVEDALAARLDAVKGGRGSDGN